LTSISRCGGAFSARSDQSSEHEGSGEGGLHGANVEAGAGKGIDANSGMPRPAAGAAPSLPWRGLQPATAHHATGSQAMPELQPQRATILHHSTALCVILRHAFIPADNSRLAHLCGSFDENLRAIETGLDVKISRRNESFRIEGRNRARSRPWGCCSRCTTRHGDRFRRKSCNWHWSRRRRGGRCWRRRRLDTRVSPARRLGGQQRPSRRGRAADASS
jgi:hypothetical protein